MTSTYTCEEETRDKKHKQPVIKVMLPGECKQHVPLTIKAAPGCWPPRDACIHIVHVLRQDT